MVQPILNSIGNFSEHDAILFEKYTTKKSLNKDEFLLKEGQVCQSVFYVLAGSFYQFQTREIDENIVDLHLPNEWMFNQLSFTNQSASTTSIKAFIKSEVIELRLSRLHDLISQSKAFLQFGRIFNQGASRVYFFDSSLTPTQKYDYIKAAKPLIPQTFPVKMIASYLKIAPETLSRVRANH
jgi:CRP-like cAMP-binding protein